MTDKKHLENLLNNIPPGPWEWVGTNPKGYEHKRLQSQCPNPDGYDPFPDVVSILGLCWPGGCGSDHVIDCVPEVAELIAKGPEIMRDLLGDIRELQDQRDKYKAGLERIRDRMSDDKGSLCWSCAKDENCTCTQELAASLLKEP